MERGNSKRRSDKRHVGKAGILMFQQFYMMCMGRRTKPVDYGTSE
jgi:hypothetical protein